MAPQRRTAPVIVGSRDIYGPPMAEILEIVEHDHNFGALAGLDRFTLTPGGSVRSEIVIEHDNITPYCLDHDSRRLIFTELPVGLDLSSRPFPFTDQLVSARRLIAVSYDELADLAAAVPAPRQLVFVFNSARAGSTLLHQILNELDEVVSYSELDFFTNLVAVAHRSDDRHGWSDLLKHCVTLFAYPVADKTVAFKFRSDCTDIADIFHEAFPTAKNLFLYRNAIDWSASWWRMHLQVDGPPVVPIEDYRADRIHRTGRATEFDAIVPTDRTTAPYSLAMLPLWLITIQAYLRHHEHGVPIVALRYEDLNTHREAMLGEVLDQIGLARDQLTPALRGFERDSQADTGLRQTGGRTNQVTLDDAQVDEIVAALARLTPPLLPDVVLPGTVNPT